MWRFVLFILLWHRVQVPGETAPAATERRLRRRFPRRCVCRGKSSVSPRGGSGVGEQRLPLWVWFSLEAQAAVISQVPMCLLKPSKHSVLINQCRSADSFPVNLVVTARPSQGTTTTVQRFVKEFCARLMSRDGFMAGTALDAHDTTWWTILRCYSFTDGKIVAPCFIEMSINRPSRHASRSNNMSTQHRHQSYAW